MSIHTFKAILQVKNYIKKRYVTIKLKKVNFFFNCYLAAPLPTLGNYLGDSLTHPMLITVCLHVRPESHCEPSEVGSPKPGQTPSGV